MSAVRSLVRRSPLVSFFILTFALCWGLGAILKGTLILAPDGSFISGILIAAVTVIALTDGRAGLKDLGHRMARWRVTPIWYAVVLGLPVVITGATLALLLLLGGAPLDATKLPSPAGAVVFFAIFMFLPVGAPVAEEIGWRGLALPRLLAGRSALTASLILGAIWAVWHLPVVLSTPELRVPVPFMLAVVPLSILTTWIFLHTRSSVFIAILFHAWFDVVLISGLGMVATADAAMMWWILAGVQTALAVIVIAIWGPHLVRKPSATEPARSDAVATA
jgi:CAAX protease family protein